MAGGGGLGARSSEKKPSLAGSSGLPFLGQSCSLSGSATLFGSCSPIDGRSFVATGGSAPWARGVGPEASCHFTWAILAASCSGLENFAEMTSCSPDLLAGHRPGRAASSPGGHCLADTACIPSAPAKEGLVHRS